MLSYSLFCITCRRTQSGFSLQSEGQGGFQDGAGSSDTDAENGGKCGDMVARRKKRTRVGNWRKKVTVNNDYSS